MKRLNAGMYCLAACLVFSPAVFSQERPPARAESRRIEDRALPEGMGEMMELVRKYHETDSEAEKSEIRSGIRKMLEEGQFAGHALNIARLKRLEDAAASAESEARGLGSEALVSGIASMRTTIGEMLDEAVSGRDTAVSARLERLLAPRRERARPESR